jgi:hypothetical protein
MVMKLTHEKYSTKEVLLAAGGAAPVPGHGASWWLQARKQIQKRHRKAFYSMVVLVARRIWLQRNAAVFRSESCSPVAVVGIVFMEFDLWCKAGLVDRSFLVHE